MDFTIDSLLEQRRKEAKEHIHESPDENEQIVFSLESDHDKQIINIFESKLEFPYPPTPFIYLFEKFENKPSGEISTFPRLKKTEYDLLTLSPKKLANSETLLFTIIQEMIIHPSVSEDLGKHLVQYSSKFPNFQIDLTTWLNFVYEISISYPSILVYVLCIARPNIFKQEFASNYANDEVIVLLLSSLLCRYVVENSVFVNLLNNLSEYLSHPVSSRIFDTFCIAFDHVDSQMFLTFPSLLPLSPNSVDFLRQSCFYLVCNLIGIDLTYEFDELIGNLDRLQAVCESDNPILVQSSLIIATLVEKLCFCLVKSKEVSVEQLERAKKAFVLQKNTKPTELVEIKEKFHITKAQIGLYIDMLSKEPADE